MNASTTFDSAAAIAAALCHPQHGVHAVADATKTPSHAVDAAHLAYAFPANRKADVCRLLAEAMKDKEKGTRQGVSVSTTISKALDGAKNFSDLELASLKAFWQLAVVADSAVNK